MKSSAYYIRAILLSTTAAIVCAAVFAAALGFHYGYQMHDLKNGSIDFSKCNQYTVIDSNHVVTACGDTLQYQWKVNLKTIHHGKK